MNKQFDELVVTNIQELERLKFPVDDNLLIEIAKGLGPSIYNIELSKISKQDKEELHRVDKYYLQKKLGLLPNPENIKVIYEVIDTFGSKSSIYRIILYYMLCKKYSKENVYLKNDNSSMEVSQDEFNQKKVFDFLYLEDDIYTLSDLKEIFNG